MRILFCGTPEFAAIVLDALLAGPHPVAGIVSQPSRPRGRGLETTEPAAVARARAAGIPVLQPVKLHAVETLDAIRSLGADLIITAAFGRILRPALLDLPPGDAGTCMRAFSRATAAPLRSALPFWPEISGPA